MEKKNLSTCTMNEAIATLKEALMKNERSCFTIKCDNCTLDIVCDGTTDRCDDITEIALFTKDGTMWHSLDMKNADGSIFTKDKPIIHNLPLICFHAFVRQFKNLSNEDMSTVWDACEYLMLSDINIKELMSSRNSD